MTRRKKELILTQPAPKEGTKLIKVRLDARTVIHLKSIKTLDFWKLRYPKAEIIG